MIRLSVFLLGEIKNKVRVVIVSSTPVILVLKLQENGNVLSS